MTDKLNGYRTVIFNTVVLVASVLAMFGIVLPQDEQTGITGAIIAIAGIFLRFKTSGPVFGSPPPPLQNPPSTPPSP